MMRIMLMLLALMTVPAVAQQSFICTMEGNTLNCLPPAAPVGKCDVVFSHAGENNRAVLATYCDPTLPAVQWFDGGKPLTGVVTITTPRTGLIYMITLPLAAGGHRFTAKGVTGTTLSADGSPAILYLQRQP